MGQEKLLTWSVSEGGEITVVTFVLFRFILSSWTQNIRILHCQDVFPLQIGGNDTGPTFSTGWSGLFLCQRTWRAGKSAPSWICYLCLLTRTFKSNVYRWFVSNIAYFVISLSWSCFISILSILGPCAVPRCEYHHYTLILNYLPVDIFLFVCCL